MDVGSKRVGIAFMSNLASKADFSLIAKREAKKAELLILDLIGKYKITTLLVGKPLNSAEGLGNQFGNIEGFANRITKRCSVNLVYVDEYLTSVEARELAAESKHVDNLAAEIILKRYLKELKLL